MTWILDIDFNIPVLNEARLRLTSLSMKDGWTHLGLYKVYKDGQLTHYNLDSDWALDTLTKAMSLINDVVKIADFVKATISFRE